MSAKREEHLNKLLLIFSFLLLLNGCSAVGKVAWVFSSNPTKNSLQSLERGKAIYESNCLSCHGIDGRGKGPLAKELATTPADLIEIAQSRWDSTFAAHVAYGKTGNQEMPAFVDKLSKEEIWDVTNFVYSLKEGSYQ